MIEAQLRKENERLRKAIEKIDDMIQTTEEQHGKINIELAEIQDEVIKDIFKITQDILYAEKKKA